MIDFNDIDADIRTPGGYVEIDSTRARRGLPDKTPRVLLVGNRLATGAVAAATLARVLSPAEARVQFGPSSILAQMAARFLAANASADVWAVGLADDGAGVAATKTITITGAATAAGVFPLYIAGRALPVAVTNGMTPAQAATALAAAVQAATDVPMTAAAAPGVVTLTARNKGTPGNSIDVRVGYYREDVLAAGLAAVIADGVAGATDPDIADAIAAIGDEAFDVIVSAWTGSANLAALETELTARWGPARQLDGLAFVGARGSQGTLATLGSAHNSRYVSIIGANASPTSPWEWAASVAGVVAHYGGIDPARPFQTLPLPGILPPATVDRFTRAERELLLRDGISTFTVDQGGVVQLERVITTYQTDGFGSADTSWLDVNTPLTLSYMRWSWRQRMLAKFPRCKLASDGTLVGVGQAIVTPKVCKAETIAWARDLASAGLLEEVDQFIADLVVERDGSDQSRLNVRMAPDIVNQARIFAAQIQFLL